MWVAEKILILSRKHTEMRFKPSSYRDLQDKSELEQSAEIAGDWLTVSMAIIAITLFLLSYQYVFQVSQALAAESVWRKLRTETPEHERNLWVYWESGECARLVQWDELGFHTSRGEPIEAKWWLYSFGDEPPPVEFCSYE